MSDPFADLPRGHFKAIYADPPWHFETWGEGGNRNVTSKYSTMSLEEMSALPVGDLAAEDCVLFMWAVWPKLFEAIDLFKAWGFTYKTCGFCWIKADDRQADFFTDSVPVQVGMGYWTRANSEPCLLGTIGKPQRLSMAVRQGIIEPRRQHSRKPDCVHGRIERLVAGPYLELFARKRQPGWHSWGNEVDKFSVEPEAAHPFDDHAQLGGAGVPLEVIAAPANDGDVADGVAVCGAEAINAR